MIEMVKKDKQKRIKKKEEGITLIALVVTIIVILILAGITLRSILGENGILKRAQESGEVYNEIEARQKLEFVLLAMQANKMVNPEYNQDDYLTAEIEKNDMLVNEDMITVDGWLFRINRNVPEIEESFGRVDNEDLTPTITVNTIDVNAWNIVAEKEEKEISKIQYKLKAEADFREQNGNIANVNQEGAYLVVVIYSDGKTSPRQQVVVGNVDFNLILNYSSDTFTTDPITIIPSTDKAVDSIKYEKGIHSESYFAQNGVEFTESNPIVETQNNTVYTVYARNSVGVEHIKYARIHNIMPELAEKGTLTTDKGMVEYIRDTQLEDGNYDLTINGETYNIAVYNYNVDVVYDRDLLLGGNEADKRTLIVKYNKNLKVETNSKITPRVRSKGMYLCVQGSLENNGEISMTAKGAIAEGQDIYLVKNIDNSYEYVPKTGGEGGASVFANRDYGDKNYYAAGIAGKNGENRATAGGGSGASHVRKYNYPSSNGYSGSGSAGTSYSGGSGRRRDFYEL